MQIEYPKVGVGVFIIRDDKFIMGKRKGSHGEGEYSLPGGHLEMFETFEACCLREVMEETNLTIRGVEPLDFVNNFFRSDGKHYVTLFFTAILDDGVEPELTEPDKCVGWEWFKFDDLPKDMFGGTRYMCEKHFPDISWSNCRFESIVNGEK